MKGQTCCFAGPCKLPPGKIENIVPNLNREVENLIAQGVTDFISGGELGFEQIAASLIIAKKEMGQKIRLIFALPYRNQDAFWTDEQKRLYRNILAEADEIIYVSEEYSDACMKKRNRYMVNRSAYCICAQIYPTGGTARTVKYARQKAVKIINAAEQAIAFI